MNSVLTVDKARDRKVERDGPRNDWGLIDPLYKGTMTALDWNRRPARARKIEELSLYHG